ncbi:hypothetical protein GCM10008111_19810 [Alishewanella tabrizica]|uniref:Uncharacterized protein n=1 Tax=Alishewanella tabrizica TaxID=671278 RepID=A0ABQ2WPF8_9ALTE|nr:hypothetical protein GCM10008111_19810 [Alishewanella tabrizica]
MKASKASQGDCSALRLRLHYKAALAGGVSKDRYAKVSFNISDFSYILFEGFSNRI